MFLINHHHQIGKCVIRWSTQRQQPWLESIICCLPTAPLISHPTSPPLISSPFQVSPLLGRKAEPTHHHLQGRNTQRQCALPLLAPGWPRLAEAPAGKDRKASGEKAGPALLTANGWKMQKRAPCPCTTSSCLWALHTSVLLKLSTEVSIGPS